MLHFLIDFFVRKRLAVIAATLAFALYGAYSYRRMSIEAFPDVTNVQVNVIAQLPGLAPEEMERQLTIPLERVLNGTPGMISLRSESLFGLSLIALTFEDDADSFKSRAIVAERLAGADVPEAAEVKIAPDATPLGEIYQFRVVSDRHDPFQTRSELDWTIIRTLRQVPGVADVVSFGGYIKEIHVEVDPARLLAFGLTLEDVTRAIEGSNRNVGGGFMRRGGQYLTIRGVGFLKDAEDIRNIVLRSDEGTPVLVGDVARLVVSHTPRLGTVGYNADTNVTEGFVLLRRGENPSEVLDGIHAKVEELNTGILPEGMRIEPFYDRSSLVALTLGTVNHNLLFGAVLVTSVIWLFLRSVRASAAVTVIIPLALMTAFIGLRLLGMPANLISMGAIDFGILVDGAVILVENIVRELQERRPKTKAEMAPIIVKAARDVAWPTMFAILIVLSSLIPVFALERVEGRIFRPLALSYSFAMGGALVFTMIAVPALCALLLRPKDAAHEEPRFVHWLRERYERALAVVLRRRRAVLAGAALLLAAAGFTGTRLGTEFLPQLDEGDLVVFVEMPPSISLEEAVPILQDIRLRLLAFPEVRDTLSEHGRPEDGTDNEGVNMSETFVHLKPLDEWRPGWDPERLVAAMRASLAEIPGVRYNFSQPIKDNVEESISGVRGQVVLKVYGTDLEAMRTALEEAKAQLKSVPGVVDLDLYRDTTIPQVQIALDRKALARAGIHVGDAQDVVETALSGRIVTELWEQERAVPVRVRFPLAERQDEQRIGEIVLAGAGGSRTPLRDVAEIKTAGGRAGINREGGIRYSALKFNVEGRDMGSVIADAMKVVKENVTPPPGHYFQWGGEFENQQRAMARLSVIVPLCLIVVFALLYGALGSVRNASAIMLSMPFAITGGIFLLFATGIPLSVSAAIGFIAMLGLVSLEGLLIVNAADALFREGVPLTDAILRGAGTRFRAILMESLLAMSGLMPMALSTGVGSDIQRPFALVMIGGMCTTLLVALFVLPILYAWFTRQPAGAPVVAPAPDAPAGG